MKYLLIFIVTVLTINILTISVYATWDSDYMYRKNLTVENSNNSIEAWIQTVKFHLNTSDLINNNKMQNDCDDLGINFNDTKIDRWVIDCNTENTTIYFKLQDTIGTNYNDTSSYILYYGNNSFDSPLNNFNDVFSEPLTNNTIVSLWMEESSGNLSDHTLNNADFEVIGNPTYQASNGIIGYSLDLDGDIDYIDIINSTKIKYLSNDEGSISFTIYQDAKTSTDYILSWGNSTDNYNFALLNPDGGTNFRFQCGVGDTAADHSGMASTTILNVTINWTSSDCFLSVNDAIIGTHTNHLEIQDYDKFYFGRYYGSTGFEFSGKIDEIKISNSSNDYSTWRMLDFIPEISVYLMNEEEYPIINISLDLNASSITCLNGSIIRHYTEKRICNDTICHIESTEEFKQCPYGCVNDVGLNGGYCMPPSYIDLGIFFGVWIALLIFIGWVLKP